MHLNARSLLPKLDELNVLASKTKAAVIGVSETWLDESVEDSEVELPGYSILLCPKESLKRDSLKNAMYIIVTNHINISISYNYMPTLLYKKCFINHLIL